MSGKTAIGLRLAFRVEGDVIRCSVAALEGPDDAIPIATISKNSAQVDPKMWDEFKEMCKAHLKRVLIEANVAGAQDATFEEWPGDAITQQEN